MQVENGFPGLLGFNITGASALTHEVNPPALPVAPNIPVLIQCEQDSHVHFTWTQSGGLIPFLNASMLEWRLDVLFEKWGNAEWSPAIPAAQRVVAFSNNNPHTYNQLITIPANSVPEGIYDIVAVLRLYNKFTGAPLPLAGFVELNKVQYYEAA